MKLFFVGFEGVPVPKRANLNVTPRATCQSIALKELVCQLYEENKVIWNRLRRSKHEVRRLQEFPSKMQAASHGEDIWVRSVVLHARV